MWYDGGMKVVLSPQAAKYLERMNEPVKGRIISALSKLEQDPPQGDIKSLSGRDGYRLRVGGYRVLFDGIENEISAYKIESRGQVYKGR